jgi:hypothetical protein
MLEADNKDSLLRVAKLDKCELTGVNDHYGSGVTKKMVFSC